MREWIEGNALATAEELNALEKEAKSSVRKAKSVAWSAYLQPILDEKDSALALLEQMDLDATLQSELQELKASKEPMRRDILSLCRRALHATNGQNDAHRRALREWVEQQMGLNHERYSSHLHSEGSLSALQIASVEPEYSESSASVDARIILRENFDRLLTEHPEVLIFGEDSGKIGDVNQGWKDCRKNTENSASATPASGRRASSVRALACPCAVFDRSQRSSTSITCLCAADHQRRSGHSAVSDKGKAEGANDHPPRGHRLEGIWHSGSPMGGVIHLLRACMCSYHAI